MDANYWIETLQLEPHPEGGFYRETYHSASWMEDDATVQRYGDRRRSATSIYFLLRSGDVSHFHRLKSDELWYFHAGDPLDVHTIDPAGNYRRLGLGLCQSAGQEPQLLVPKGHIFGSSPQASTAPCEGYSLVSCMVTPGFDFRDFELFQQDQLLELYPNQEQIIRRLTLP
ncbi:cupin domain-containing protein [Alicyclobacillus acidiphilus]|uniref:cupin domain-containing protein n=1 Tax=Alicyclobacillus acidiphilus TaxID=182455 RepID=UPI00082C2FCC|nr:cupin domain-containing protein [Alicyclobacillus acidiphilus]